MTGLDHTATFISPVEVQMCLIRPFLDRAIMQPNLAIHP